MGLGYSEGEFRGLPLFSCDHPKCAFNSLDDEDRMIRHVSKCHPQQTGPEPCLSEWMASIWDEEQARPTTRIALSLLTWNHEHCVEHSLSALMEEAIRLELLNFDPCVMVRDNGSTDRTWEKVACLARGPMDFYLAWNGSNLGISRARNQVIEQALKIGAEFLLFVDGDISAVPGATWAMADYLRRHPSVGVIGAWSSSYTDKVERASRQHLRIPDEMVSASIPCAWTQYGLFRVEMFRKGIRFEESGPFGQPGWGCEDSELFLQMEAAGWENHYFRGMTYLHEHIRSSIVNLMKEGKDAESLFHARKNYMLNKWGKSGSKWIRQMSTETYPKVIGQRRDLRKAVGV